MERINLQMFAEPELPDNTITPEMNYETEAFINVAEPSAPTATWASLAALTKNMAQSLNEVLYQATYYADKGWGSTEVTGAQRIWFKLWRVVSSTGWSIRKREKRREARCRIKGKRILCCY